FEHDTSLTGMPSGLDALDEMACGFQPGELTVIAARPSMGKTSLALDIARAICFQSRRAVILFSAEMPRDAIVLRLLATEATVDSQILRTGRLTDADWGRLAHAAQQVNAMQIH